MKNLDQFCQDLETTIANAYSESVTVDEAEKLASRFLHAMMILSKHLQDADLESRMRKSGLKAVKARVYMDACSAAEKKPTEALLDHTLNTNDIVSGEQDAFDQAEAKRDGLERYYNIFRESHIFFRGIAKGGFNG